MKGSFTPGSNILKTSNPYLTFEMTANEQGYFQSAVEQVSPSKKISRTERIDIVTGLARKGQSYLFWKGDQLFQLPVTYWTATDSWVNSPSYPDGSPHFDKHIIPRCLECHASYFEWLPPPVNRYRKTSLVLGIFCEKCHGPGREHVALHRGEVVSACGKRGGDREPGLAPAGSANRYMWFVPFGQRNADPARVIVPSRGCARRLH